MMSKTIIYHYNIEIFTGNAYLFQKFHNVNIISVQLQSRLARPEAPPTSALCVLGLLPNVSCLESLGLWLVTSSDRWFFIVWAV